MIETTKDEPRGVSKLHKAANDQANILSDIFAELLVDSLLNAE